MADIFISYAREDRVLVEALAAKLEAAGYSVSWDLPGFPPGIEWQDALRRQISAAGAVIVLWTRASVRSRVVRAEAELALGYNKLIAVKTDDLDYDQIPDLFRNLHVESAASLERIEAAVRVQLHLRAAPPAYQSYEPAPSYRGAPGSDRRPASRVDRRMLALALLVGIGGTVSVLALAFVALDETKVAGLLAKPTTHGQPPPPPSPLDVVDIDLFYRGNDLDGYPQLVQTSLECRRACALRSDCAGFSYVSADRLCYLKTAIANTGKREGVISGRTVRSPLPP